MKSANSYWQHRLSNKVYKNNVPKLEKELLKLYQQANESIKRDIELLYIEMLEGGEVSAYQLFRSKRFKSLQENINKQINKLGHVEDKKVTTVLNKAYKDIYISTIGVMDNSFVWSMINERVAEQIIYSNLHGATFSDRIWSNKFKLKELLEKSVVDTVISGKSKDTAVKEIRKRFGVGFNDADRIVRTETQRVINEGQRQTYKDRGYTQVNWLVADDERLCDECMAIGQGSPYGIDEVPAIVHPNCRCTIIPVVEY